MKKLLLGLSLMIIGLAAMGQTVLEVAEVTVNQPGVERMLVEHIEVPAAAALPAGSICYRVFVDMEANYKLIGFPGFEIPRAVTIQSSSTGFYNWNLTGNVEIGTAVFSALFAAYPALQWDTYLADGRVGGTGQIGVPYSYDTDGTLDGLVAAAANGCTLNTMAIVYANAPGNPDLVGAAGTSMVDVENFGLAVPGSQEGYQFATENLIFVGQFTTDGDITLELNFDLNNPSGVLTQVSNVYYTSVEVVNDPPVVSMTAPVATANVNDIITFSATATDNDGTVAGVSFYINGTANAGVYNAVSGAWEFEWTAAGQSNSVYAVATDDLGAVSLPSPTYTIAVNDPNGSPVIDAITVPAEVNINDPYQVVVTATDDNYGGVGVTGVILSIDGTPSAVVGTQSGDDWTFDLTAPATRNVTLTFTAVATDGHSNSTSAISATTRTVDPSGAYYELNDQTVPCYEADIFCVSVTKNGNGAALSGVIGFDAVMGYDPAMVVPTGLVYLSDDMISNRDLATYALRVENDSVYITVFLKPSAGSGISWNGAGDAFCVEFAILPSFGSNASTAFTMPRIVESYVDGTSKEAAFDGSFATEAQTNFNGSLVFWADNSPMSYDAVNPTDFAVIDISDATDGAPVVHPDMAGDFIWDVTEGTSIQINKDMPSGTVVISAINGMDAQLAARVALQDPAFRPRIQQIIAMDVNRDQVISAGDISQINQRTVLARDEFAQVDESGVAVASPSNDWLFLDPSDLLSDLSYRISTSWPYDDGTGYSKSRVPFKVQEFDVPGSNLTTDCPIVDEKTYQAVLVGDIDGTYKDVTTLGTGLKSASVEKIRFDLIEAGNDVKVKVSFEASAAVVALDFDFLTHAELSSHEMVVEGLCFQNGERVTCTSYSMKEYKEGTVMTLTFKDAKFENLNVENALINGKAVDYTIKVSAEPNAATLFEAAKIEVYPNPAYNELNVVVADEAQIAIYNTLGELIDNGMAYNGIATFNVQNYASGIYQIKVIQGENVQTVSVVIE